MSAYIRGKMFRPIGKAAGKPRPTRLYAPADDESDEEEGEERAEVRPEAVASRSAPEVMVMDDDEDYEDEEEEEEEDEEDAEDEGDEEEEDGVGEELPYDEQRPLLTVWVPEDEDEDQSITAAKETTLRRSPMVEERSRLVDVRPKIVLAVAEDYDDEEEDYDEEDDYAILEKFRGPPIVPEVQPKPVTKPEAKVPISPIRTTKSFGEAIKMGSSPPSTIKQEIKSQGLPPIPPFRPEAKQAEPKNFKPEVVSAAFKPEVKLSRQEVLSSRPTASSFTRPVAVPMTKQEAPPMVTQPEAPTEVVELPIKYDDTYLSYLSLPVELARDAVSAAREVVDELRQLACGDEERHDADVGWWWRPSPHFRAACFHYVSLLMATYVYLFAGAFLFKLLEGFFEVSTKCDVQRHRRDLIEDLWNRSAFLDYDDWRRAAREHLRHFEDTVHKAHQQGATSYSGTQTWSLDGALVYSATILTTIGYGHIVPSTTAGRVATILYAIVGIPLLLMVLADFGKLLTRAIKCLLSFAVRFYHTGSCRKLRRTRPVKAMAKLMFAQQPTDGASDVHQEYGDEGGGTAYDDEGNEEPVYPAIDDEFDLPAWITILLLVGYILAGASMFIQWEQHWTYFEAVYFVFISMSTIGFGDFVPEHPIFMMGTFVYLLFGLALTSMCINVIQESLTKSFRQASIKLSARMGLELTEVAPAPHQPEVAPVHQQAKRKEH